MLFSFSPSFFCYSYLICNKYTFVWKKAVTKNQAKLLIKLADFVAECKQLYDIKIVYGNVIKIKHLKRLRKKLYALKNAGNITFVHGIGKAHLET